jgi:hypothetical protein
MSTDFQNKIDIEPLLKQVNGVLTKGLNKLICNYVVQNLKNELDTCRKQMEFYKAELENVKRYYKKDNMSFDSLVEGFDDEHISLNIEDNCDNNSETSLENILSDDNKSSNVQIFTTVGTTQPVASLEDEEEEEDASLEAEEEEEEEEEDAGLEAEDEAEDAGLKVEESVAHEDAVASLEEDEDAVTSLEEEDEDAVASLEEEDESDEDEDESVADEDEDADEVAGLEAEAEAESETEAEDEAEDEAEAEDEEPVAGLDEDEDEDEEEEVFEIEIDDVTYYATNEENGPLYEVDESGDPGKLVGHLKDGEPVFL